MDNLVEAIANYVRETRRLESLPNSTEPSFYPDLRTLLTAVLKTGRLPFEVIVSTSEGAARRRDMPDFILGDSSLFVAVFGEVKRADTELDELAVSTENDDQIGQYLSQTGVVLLCNVRAIGLLTCDPAYERQPGVPVPVARRVLEKPVDLWSAVTGKLKVDAAVAEDLAALVTRAVTDLARIGSLRRCDGGQVRPDDLKITITYWGGGKGGWKPRAFMAEELPAGDYSDAWGERTGDLYLNDNAFFANVPELVRAYQLGGYPVLKKWLGYRQADRRDGSPLTDEERRWFRQMVQRVAALLALGPRLDALYQEAAANAFTAEALGIAR